MRMKYWVVFVVVSLLMLLSVSVSFMNYFVSLESTQKQLQTRSLPLTTDNIYTEIQKHVIEPNLVASMMAEDTFLKEWLIHREESDENIKNYLEAIKNKYGMLTAFVTSQSTQNYYTAKGFVEQMREDNPTNKWYYEFKDSPLKHEINLDYNEHIDNAMIMFINHKIFNTDYHMIGATGVGFKISYIDEMLKKFRLEYLFNVYFINDKGELILYERDFHKIKNINEVKELHAQKDKIINKAGGVVEIYKDAEKYLVNVKYVSELDLYLIVEAQVSVFTQEVKRIFYINLFVSLLVTLFVTLIILKTISVYNKKLEYMASNDTLTNLSNRRRFNIDFKKIFLLKSRQKNELSLLFFDIDNFKSINDNLGHQVGDEVLKRFSKIIKLSVRQTDLLARWGGEEFIVAFIDSSLEDSQLIAEKIRASIEIDTALHKLVGHSVTASFGLTAILEQDSIDSAIKRVDDAMYQAKKEGKNRVVVL